METFNIALPEKEFNLVLSALSFQAHCMRELGPVGKDYKEVNDLYRSLSKMTD